MKTQFGWRADVRGFRQGPEDWWDGGWGPTWEPAPISDVPAGDVVATSGDAPTGTVDYGTETYNPFVTSPFVYNPATDVSSPTPSAGAGTNVLGSLFGVLTGAAGTVANVAVTKAVQDWLGVEKQNPKAAGTLLTAPDGSRFKWNAAGQLEQVSKPLPGWVIPVAIGGGVLLIAGILLATRR